MNKAKVYYSNEALNPRPKRGRPPKQSAKVESETTISSDIYTKVPAVARRFLFLPEITSASSITFSEKFDTEEEFLANLRGSGRVEDQLNLANLSERFASLKELSAKLGYDSYLQGISSGMTTTIVMTRSQHLRAVKLLLSAVVRNPNGLDLLSIQIVAARKLASFFSYLEFSPTEELF